MRKKLSKGQKISPQFRSENKSLVTDWIRANHLCQALSFSLFGYPLLKLCLNYILNLNRDQLVGLKKLNLVSRKSSSPCFTDPRARPLLLNIRNYFSKLPPISFALYLCLFLTLSLWLSLAHTLSHTHTFAPLDIRDERF